MGKFKEQNINEIHSSMMLHLTKNSNFEVVVCQGEEGEFITLDIGENASRINIFLDMELLKKLQKETNTFIKKHGGKK